jgi:cytochrome P450
MTIAVDPASREFRESAIPIFQRLLREQPLTRLQNGGVLLCRHEDVGWALTSPDVLRATKWSVSRKPPGPFREFARHNVVGMNAPDHTRLRQAIMPAFTRRRTDALAGFIERTCDALLARMAERGACDFIEDFAMPLPVKVICHLLGVPSAEEQVLREGSDAMLAGLEITATPEIFERATRGAATLFEYLQRLAAERNRALGDDLLSQLLTNEREGRLSRDEVVWASISLLMAGHETTTHLIGNGLLALMRNPDQEARLRREPALIPNAVDEFLRYDPPIYVLYRETAADVRILDTEIAAGTFLVLSIVGANRDPRVFGAPDALDVSRKNAAEHLSFAAGRHLCSGHALARLEGKIAFEKLLRRLPRFELTAEPTPRQGVMFKGYHAMPIAYAVDATGVQ